jgi:predicted RNase H-like HicB family nuclease
MTCAASIEYDPETKLYIGTVSSIPGAHTQGETLEELRVNLAEVIQLCLVQQPELEDERAISSAWPRLKSDDGKAANLDRQGVGARASPVGVRGCEGEGQSRQERKRNSYSN